MKASRVVLVLVVAAAVGAFLWLRQPETKLPPPPPPATAPAPPAPPPAPAEPAIKHPLGPSPKNPLPRLAEADEYVKNALADLLGRKGMLSFLQVNDFVRRCVATVDNLANEAPSSHMWPVSPTPGRFDAETRAEGSVISTKNADRYAPFVRFVAAVDTHKAVALYLRLYPLFQQAYEELGFAGKYFNDRVVEVIDHLLATREVAGPVKVKLLAAGDPSRPGKSVGFYQFQDPELEARSAGQKILLRVGPDNAAKLKAKLSEVRQQIVRGGAQRR